MTGLPHYPTPDTPAPVPGPLGVVETVTTALSLYRRDARALWATTALAVLPLQLLVLLLELASVPAGTVVDGSSVTVPAGSGSLFAGLDSAGSLVTVLTLFLAIGAAYRILLGRHLHHPASVRASLGFAVERLGPLLWVSILTALVVFVGFLLLIVPGIYLFVALAVAVPVMMAEDRRGLAALQRSRELVTGHWAHVLGALFVAALVAVLGQLLLAALTAGLISGVAPHSVDGALAISALGDVVIGVVFYPFTAAVPVVLYVDLLLRGRDPQLDRLLAP